MTGPKQDALALLVEIVGRACACGEPRWKLRAIARAQVRVLDGEPVSAPRFEGAPALDAAFAARVHRVECAGCRAAAWTREECPACRAPQGLPRALDGRNGIAPPRACPRCALEELDLTVELRMHIETLHGRPSRRRADAEAHEGGWHVIEARCPDCAEVIAAVGEARCGVCGRSALLKRMH